MKGQQRHTVLVSGFEEFGGEDVNPSQQLAANVHGTRIANHSVESVILPVTFEGAFSALADAINRVQPTVVIGLGQAGGREAICVERVAVNVCDAPIPDNAGEQPRSTDIDPSGPDTFGTTLPAAAIVAALRADNIRAEMSNSAGTFVCNHVFYQLMNLLRDTPNVIGGFVHVPYLPEQVPEQVTEAPIPSMSLLEMERGLRIAIAVALSA